MSEKPELKMISLPTYRVKYRDLEAFIREIYGFDCDVLYASGMTHGMIPEYVVNGLIPESLQGLRGRLSLRRPIRNLCLILNDLAAEGYIPKGNYLIDTHKEQDDTEAYRTILLESRNPDSPECIEFRAQRSNNKQLQERFAVLDREMRQEVHRSRR